MICETPLPTLEVVQRDLLMPTAIALEDLEQALARLSGPHIDFADLYVQDLVQEHYTLEEGSVKSITHSVDRGVGVRAVSGERTGFSYVDALDLAGIREAAEAARWISYSGDLSPVRIRTPVHTPALYAAQNPIATMLPAEKVALLREIDVLARAADPRVTRVVASLSGRYEQVLILRSDGVLAADIRPLVRLDVQVVVEAHGRRESGSAGGGGRTAYTVFSNAAAAYAQEAVRMALVNLEAGPAPAGPMPVVLGPGWPAVLLHEAVGHGLEGDFNRKGASVYSDCLGKPVAAPGCTVVDDGTLPDRRGSLSIDDEGTPTQRTVLIENGILVNYLQDTLNARLMGRAPTGNGRRESYAHPPMPRMTNTFLMPGPHDPADIIASVEDGVYAVHFGGGSVDITSGQFVFSASEAYRIQNGRITDPVKGATLIGNGPDVMRQITHVGNNLAFDTGVGNCGKDGQQVPVGVGQPTIRVEGLTVGGTVI